MIGIIIEHVSYYSYLIKQPLHTNEKRNDADISEIRDTETTGESKRDDDSEMEQTLLLFLLLLLLRYRYTDAIDRGRARSIK